jgi:hypothetical protein
VINDSIFKIKYFNEFVNEICYWEEYKQLKELIDKTEYYVRFDFSKTKSFFNIIYFIEIEICDSSNRLVSVPKDSVFYDRLFNLCASGSVLSYNTLNHKVIKKIDNVEIKDDFHAIINYLNYILNNNISS